MYSSFTITMLGTTSKKYNTRSHTLNSSTMVSPRSRTGRFPEPVTFIEHPTSPIISPRREIIDLTNLSSDSDDEDSDVFPPTLSVVSESDSNEVYNTHSTTPGEVKIEKSGYPFVSTVKISNASMVNITSTLRDIQMLAKSNPESEKLFVALSCIPMMSILLYIFYPISSFILTAPWFAILYMWKTQFKATEMYPTHIKEN